MIKLQYLGHCCFYLHGDDGAKLLTDPMDPTLGYAYPDFPVDLVLVSRSHMAHNAISLLPGNPAIFMGQGERKVGRIHIQGIAASETQSELNTVFVWRYQGLRFCHLGAVGDNWDTHLKNQIGDEVDVLFLPVGGGEYLKPEVASHVMRQIAPKVAVPMSYQTSAKQNDLLPLSEFMDKNAVPVIEAKDFYDLDFRKIKALTETHVLRMNYAAA